MANLLQLNSVTPSKSNRSLRCALTAGVAIALVASLVSAADARKARRHEESVRVSGKKKEEPKLPFGELPKGPLQIVVSTGSQHATLYANGKRVEQTKVSTGTPQKPTPHGVFSVIEKDRYHHSNLYGNAPMYYMHRLTWSGVAMHEGMLPGFAASHGCIRMPTSFVSRLWQISKLGIRVVVVRNDPEPYEFSHAKLFNPRQKPAADKLAEASPDLRPSLAAVDITTGSGGRLIVLAQNGDVVIDGAGKSPGEAGQDPGARVIVQGDGKEGEPAKQAEMPKQGEQVQTGAAQSEVETTASTPVAPAQPGAPVTADTPAALPAGQAAEAPVSSEPAKRDVTDPEPRKPAPPRTRTAEPAKRSGQVAVFISKKEKKIFVRQGSVPVFDMPIEIANPDVPLGTHVFTALQATDDGAHMRWNAIDLPPDQGRAADQGGSKKKGRRAEPPPQPMAALKPQSNATEALDRVTIPQEAIDRISELLVPGSSLVISDYGLGNETGRMTEFIVVTR